MLLTSYYCTMVFGCFLLLTFIPYRSIAMHLLTIIKYCSYRLDSLQMKRVTVVKLVRWFMMPACCCAACMLFVLICFLSVSLQHRSCSTHVTLPSHMRRNVTSKLPDLTNATWCHAGLVTVNLTRRSGFEVVAHVT